VYIVGVEIRGPKKAKHVLEKLEGHRKENDIFIQVLNTEKVIGKEHLLWAFQKAEESFENGTNRANSLEMETLLWASAEWQIKNALYKMGIADEAEEAALMIEDKEHLEDLLDFMDWVRNDEVLEPSEEKLKNFGLEESEIASVKEPYDLVFEKMATSVL